MCVLMRTYWAGVGGGGGGEEEGSACALWNKKNCGWGLEVESFLVADAGRSISGSCKWLVDNKCVSLTTLSLCYYRCWRHHHLCHDLCWRHHLCHDSCWRHNHCRCHHTTAYAQSDNQSSFFYASFRHSFDLRIYWQSFVDCSSDAFIRTLWVFLCMHVKVSETNPRLRRNVNRAAVGHDDTDLLFRWSTR